MIWLFDDRFKGDNPGKPTKQYRDGHSGRLGSASRFLASAGPLASLVLTERADLYGNVPSSSLERTLVIVIDTFVVRQSRPELAIVVDNSLPITFLFTAAT
jgi:hypothetical protein